jgi:hypothetical protein
VRPRRVERLRLAQWANDRHWSFLSCDDGGRLRLEELVVLVANLRSANGTDGHVILWPQKSDAA